MSISPCAVFLMRLKKEAVLAVLDSKQGLTTGTGQAMSRILKRNLLNIFEVRFAVAVA